jgi:hypothetical protein
MPQNYSTGTSSWSNQLAHFPQLPQVTYSCLRLKLMGRNTKYIHDTNNKAHRAYDIGWNVQVPDGKIATGSFKAFITECGVGRNVCAPQWRLVVSGSTNSWIKNTILLMVNNHLEIHHDIEVLSSCRNDNFRMARWAGHGSSEGTQIRLNRCRLYMGISSLAEVVSGDRKSILKHLFEGDKTSPQKSIMWLIQQKPNKKDWKAWKECL